MAKLNLNKGISTSTGVLIIVVCALLAGGIFAWQYKGLSKEEIKIPNKINVSFPNGGETWETGKTYEIKWNCPDGAELDIVDIFIKDKRGSIEKPIGSLIKCSLGRYSWKVRSVSPGEDSFKVQLRHIAGVQSVIDESDDYFTIVEPEKSLTVLSPNGGEEWKIGSRQVIKWSTKNVPLSHKISVLIRRVPPPPLQEHGQEFDPIVFIDLKNDGEENWIISDMYPEGRYIISLTSYESLPPTKDIGGESDSYFNIVK